MFFFRAEGRSLHLARAAEGIIHRFGLRAELAAVDAGLQPSVVGIGEDNGLAGRGVVFFDPILHQIRISTKLGLANR